jgi:hypothetical protein
MKITNNNTGESYVLYPKTEIEIERTNPFFNTYGEQSLPISIPTEPNSQQLGNPHDPNNKSKPDQSILVTISDGDYIQQARQSVLSSQQKKNTSMAFYINEGSLYAAMPDTTVKSVFGDETVSGVTTTLQGIEFCRSLLTGTDERFTIFPVLIDGETDTEKRWINRLDFIGADGAYVGRLRVEPLKNIALTPSLYNSFVRTETINDETITIPVGTYISPFIKGNYLLKRIFQFFGYTLEDSFLNDEPFASMAFINNTADTLAKGVIRFSDVVPSLSCSDILDIYRKKFHAEFIPNEQTKTIRFVQFDSTLSSPPSVDLSKSLTSKPIIEFPKKYRQIKMVSADSITDTDTKQFDNVKSLFTSYPTAVLDKTDQCFYRTGLFEGVINYDRVGLSSIPYQAELSLQVEEISIPDCMPLMLTTDVVAYNVFISGDTRTGKHYIPMPYIGTGNFLNSKLHSDSSDDTSVESVTDSATVDQKAILAFQYDGNGHGYLLGTISNYDFLNEKLWNCSLCYNGSDGLFETFYRKYDDLLRNSLHTYRADLLLTNQQKRSVPSHEKIIINGMELLINSLKYKIGYSSDPEESEFFTINIYSPVDSAMEESIRLSWPAYRWSAYLSKVSMTVEQYNASPYKELITPIFFPDHPTALNQSMTYYSAKKIGTSYWMYTYRYTSVAY